MTTLLYDLDIVAEHAIAVITLNRPDKLNALNQTVLAELFEAIQMANDNPQVRGILITGSGNKSFVAGADISGFVGLSPDEAQVLAESGQRVFDTITASPKPVLAAINGFALGGGCELAMACHLRFASENAKFGQPEVNLGLIPGYGGTQRLTRIIGLGRALEMMLSGAAISAQRAYEMGLVNQVFPAEELLSASLKWLHNIAGTAPVAQQHILRAAQHQGNLAEGLAYEAVLFGECFRSADAKEGISAFLEKRKPNFSGS